MVDHDRTVAPKDVPPSPQNLQICYKKKSHSVKTIMLRILKGRNCLDRPITELTAATETNTSAHPGHFGKISWI